MPSWLRYLFASYIPLICAFFLPRSVAPYCVAVSGILFTIAVIKLVSYYLRNRLVSEAEEAEADRGDDGIH